MEGTGRHAVFKVNIACWVVKISSFRDWFILMSILMSNAIHCAMGANSLSIWISVHLLLLLA
jgi:hypothetical protein